MSNELQPQILDLNNLTPEQSLQVQARILGFKRMPVTIEQFIEDPYYLGNSWGGGKLYPYWKEVLMKLFPTPIHIAYNFLILTGPIGGGKTTVSTISALYLLHRLACLDNFGYFGIQIEKTIDFLFHHTSAGNAYSLQMEPTWSQMSKSPYFQTEFKDFDGYYSFQAEGLRNDQSTGHDIIFYAFSEINFIDYDRVKFKIDQAISRLKARFIKVLDYFGLIIIDSSAASEGSLVEDLIREYPVNMLVVRDPVWKIKASTGAYFKTKGKDGKTYFTVFTGDGTHDPYIVDEEHPLLPDCDPDKLLKVPNELLPDYLSNIELALQNTAGIGTAISDVFITDKDALRRSFSIPKHIPDTTLVDFFDENERLFDIIKPQILKEVPEDKILCIGIDLGITGDITGFSASYMEDYVRDKEGKPSVEIITKTPLCIGISRKPGQETRIRKIYELIMDINKVREVGLVVADGFQSRELLQDLSAKGIYNYLSSVDRTKDPYIFYKLQIYKGYQKSINNSRLKRESEDIRDVGYKIDHTSVGSKDLLDSLVNSVYNISLSPDHFMQLSKTYSTKIQMESLNQFMTAQDEINDFLENRRF